MWLTAIIGALTPQVAKPVSKIVGAGVGAIAGYAINRWALPPDLFPGDLQGHVESAIMILLTGQGIYSSPPNAPRD
jgi:hypothetical protein